jgi:integrase
VTGADRDPESSEPFTVEELELVIRAGDASELGPYPGFLGRVARVLAYTGVHIVLFSGGYRQKLRPDGALEMTPIEPLGSWAIRGDFIYWRRVKTNKPIPMPVSRHLVGWLGEFLDLPRPGSDERYRQLLAALGRSMNLQVNPLRFRHTCAVLLFHVHHVQVDDIQRMLGVTRSTLLTYIARPKWMVQRELVESGW